MYVTEREREREICEGVSWESDRPSDINKKEREKQRSRCEGVCGESDRPVLVRLCDFFSLYEFFPSKRIGVMLSIIDVILCNHMNAHGYLICIFDMIIFYQRNSYMNMFHPRNTCDYFPCEHLTWWFSIQEILIWLFSIKEILMILFHMITWYAYFMKENSFYASLVFFVSLLTWLFCSSLASLVLIFGCHIYLNVNRSILKCQGTVESVRASFFFSRQTVVLNHTWEGVTVQTWLSHVPQINDLCVTWLGGFRSCCWFFLFPTNGITLLFIVV